MAARGCRRGWCPRRCCPCEGGADEGGTGEGGADERGAGEGGADERGAGERGTGVGDDGLEHDDDHCTNAATACQCEAGVSGQHDAG